MSGPYVAGPFGEHISLLNPRGSMLNIYSIARSLSRLPRFTGHTLGTPYSVGQHSIGASYIVPPALALEALLHDAAEFALNDLSTPVKNLCPDYQRLESIMDRAIRERFDLPDRMSPAVKRADLIMLATEKRDLLATDYEEWTILRGIDPLPGRLRPHWSWRYTYWRFMRRFHEIEHWPR